ncbi:hypothetical protein OSTOST_24233, partial [Ostertagia ostertagi]
FIEAVIQYTGAKKVDVIAHSVGVVLARKALKGGLCVCQLAQTVPAWCNALDGLYPGYTCQD